MGAPFHAVGRRLVEALLPRACLACHRLLAESAAPIGLCPPCHGRLIPLELPRRCRHCLRPLPAATAGRSACLDCRAHSPALDRLAACWSYREPLRAVLHAIKFRRLDGLAAALAREALAREPLAAFDTVDCVVPVPLALWRRLGRGFNQAERIASPIAWHLDRPLVGALVRDSFGSRRQSRLGRAARQLNPGAGLRLLAAAQPALDGRSVLLIDDIVTTGSTLAAAAALLRRAGAARVAALALAATPRAAFGEAVDRP